MRARGTKARTQPHVACVFCSATSSVEWASGIVRKGQWATLPDATNIQPATQPAAWSMRPLRCRTWRAMHVSASVQEWMYMYACWPRLQGNQDKQNCWVHMFFLDQCSPSAVLSEGTLDSQCSLKFHRRECGLKNIKWFYKQLSMITLHSAWLAFSWKTWFNFFLNLLIFCRDRVRRSRACVATCSGVACLDL